jgi:hypothetical protein
MVDIKGGEKLNLWCNQWLSKEGCLVLVKVVLEAIPVYWMSLAWIPKGVLELIRILCYRFIWLGDQVKKCIALGFLEKNCSSKGSRGLGIK